MCFYINGFDSALEVDTDYTADLINEKIDQIAEDSGLGPKNESIKE